MSKKILVGGYLDDRIFEGECFEGKTPWSVETLGMYTIEEALKLGFVENIVDQYKDWYELTEQEKGKSIERYTENDEIARLSYFETEEEALKFYNEHLEQAQSYEDDIKAGKIIYTGKKQNNYGYFIEHYELKSK